MKIVKLVGAVRLFLIPLALVTTAPARADFTPVSIESLTNADIRTFTGGNNYPIAPTTNDVAGVPFDLVPLTNTPNSLGVIQTPGGVTTSFTILTNVFGASTVYTLMNSAFGAFGADIGSIEFKGANGSDVTFQIVEGDNIRDHFDDGFNNVATNIVPNSYLNGSQVPDSDGPDRLDMQTFVLPSSFASDTLTQIIFTGFGGDPQGEPFLAAATVETPSAVVPEPSTLLLLGQGVAALLGLAWCGHHKLRTAAA